MTLRAGPRTVGKSLRRALKRGKPEPPEPSIFSCPKGHKIDPSAQFCPVCGHPTELLEDKRKPIMIRAKPSAEQDLHDLANHISHGQYGEAFELSMTFVKQFVNGKATPDQVRDVWETSSSIVKRAWEIIYNEKADADYAFRKAARELMEAKKKKEEGAAGEGS